MDGHDCRGLLVTRLQRFRLEAFGEPGAHLTTGGPSLGFLLAYHSNAFHSKIKMRFGKIDRINRM